MNRSILVQGEKIRKDKQAAGVFQSQAYMETIRPDEESFLDLHACEFLVATENEVIPLS